MDQPSNSNNTDNNDEVSYKKNNVDNGIHRLSAFSIKSPYGNDPLKEDTIFSTLTDDYSSMENLFRPFPINNKSAKCLVDINKIYDISKKMEVYYSQQKKLVTTMNHIINQYNTLNKNFKKIQKEFNNIMKVPNENDKSSSLDKKLSIPDLPDNVADIINEIKTSNPIIPGVEEINKSLYMDPLPNDVLQILSERVEKILVEEGTNIITDNEDDGSIFYLTGGEAYVCDFFENKIAKIHTDFWFGFSSILRKKRTANIRTTMDCKLYKLTVEDLEYALSQNEKTKEQYEKKKAEYSEIYEHFKDNSKKDSISRFRNEFLFELTLHILKKIPLFEHLDMKFSFDLVLNMIPEVVSKGKIIISRDDDPDCLYCILNGTVEVFSYSEGKSKNNDSHNSGILVHAELSSDSFFGEIGLLLDMRRTSSIRIKEKSFLIKLTKEILLDISNKYPDVNLGIDERVNGCKMALQENKKANGDSLELFDLEVNCQNLRKIKLFNNFDNNTLEEIAFGMTRKSYKPNDYIIKCGDNAESMFFLTHGSIEVLSENNKIIDIAKGPNVYFGEVALLENVPRTASIKATTPCSVFVLTKDTLLSVLKKNPQFEAEIEKTSRERLQAHLMRSILA